MPRARNLFVTLLLTLLFAEACADAGPLGSVASKFLTLGGRTATVRTWLTDAPIDVDEVWVTIFEVRAHRAGDDDNGDADDSRDDDGQWHVIVDEPQTVDLLKLRDAFTLLNTQQIEPGFYTQIRLVLSEASIVIHSEEFELDVPSGPQSGIKIPFGREVEPDVEYDLVLDFDAAESISQTGEGRWILKPVIRVESFDPVDDDGTADNGETDDTERKGR